MNEDELFFEDDFESVAENSEDHQDRFEEQTASVEHFSLPLQQEQERPILSSQEAANFVWYESSALSSRSNRGIVNNNRNLVEDQEMTPTKIHNNLNPVNLFKINSRKEFLDLVLQVASRDVKMCLAGVNITHPDIFYTTKQLLEEKREEFIQKQKNKEVHQKHQKQLKEFAQKQQHQLQQMELEAKHKELELKQRELEQKQREWEQRLTASAAATSKKEAMSNKPPRQEEKPISTVQIIKQEPTPVVEKKLQSSNKNETKKAQNKSVSQQVTQQPVSKTTPRQVHFSDSHVEEFYNAAITEKEQQQNNDTQHKDSQIAFYKPKAKKTPTRKISDLEKKLRLQEELQKKLKTRLDNLQLETKTQPNIETAPVKKVVTVPSKNASDEQSILKQLLPEDRELLDLSKILHGVEKDIKVDNMLHMLEKYEAKDKEIAQRYSGKNPYRVSMSYSDISTSSSVANSHIFDTSAEDFPLVYDKDVLDQIYGYKEAFQKFLDQTDYAILRKSSDLPPNAVSDLLCEYIMEEVLMECAKEVQSIGNATVQAIFDAEFTIRNSLSVSCIIPQEVFEAAKVAQ